MHGHLCFFRHYTLKMSMYCTRKPEHPSPQPTRTLKLTHPNNITAPCSTQPISHFYSTLDGFSAISQKAQKVQSALRTNYLRRYCKIVSPYPDPHLTHAITLTLTLTSLTHAIAPTVTCLHRHCKNCLLAKGKECSPDHADPDSRLNGKSKLQSQVSGGFCTYVSL